MWAPPCLRGAVERGSAGRGSRASTGRFLHFQLFLSAAFLLLADGCEPLESGDREVEGAQLLTEVLDKGLGFLWNHSVDITEIDAEWNRNF